MRVGVTGAGGFVGTRVISELAMRGIAARAISRRMPDALPRGTEWAASPDLGPDADWSAALSGLDTLIHAAARVHVMRENDQDPLAAFRRVNVDGTLRLAGQAAEAGVKRFIFLSSVKVQGEATEPGSAFRASDVPRPVDAYGVSKLEAERALFALVGETGMEIVAIRPVLVYGPGVKANFRTIMKAVALGLPMPFGKVRNARSMIFVGNLADLVIRAAQHPQAAGQVFLASDGNDLSTGELAAGLASALGRKPRLVPVPVGPMLLAARLLGKGAVARRLLGSLAVDITPTRKLLDWAPPYTVREGLAETVAAYMAEREQSAA